MLNQESSLGISSRNPPRNKFTDDDDKRLKQVVDEIGTDSWQEVAKKMGNRNSRQCKERWQKYLCPDVNKSQFTPEEDQLLLEKYKSMGSKWVAMKSFFQGRTDAALKNRFKVLQRQKMKDQKRKSLFRMYKIHLSETSDEDELPIEKTDTVENHVICAISPTKSPDNQSESAFVPENYDVFNEFVCF